MKIVRRIFNLLTRHLRKFGLMQSLSFDQQVWGAKSVMDLEQFKSRFMLAEAAPGATMYTVWLGSRDQKPYAISVDVNGHATTPTQDDSRIGDCGAWSYPPKLSCAQAQAALVKAGITDAWTFCRLRQTVDSPQANPFYDFVLSTGKTAHVDANTGQVTPL
jgi:hypothetical protein